MKRNWLKYLKDPMGGGDLKLDNDSVISESGEIVSGAMFNKTKNKYKIVNGIPVFITNKTQSLKSVASFAYEWEQFGFLFAKKAWIDNLIKPLLGSDKFFRGKIVVDAGAGSGSQSRWIAEAGAKFVFSLELSNVIYTEHASTIKQYKEKIFPIQCDIAYPPLNIKPDIIYCMNVIQHTKRPMETFLALTKLMGEKTIFLFNIYDKDKNSSFRITVIKVARFITHFLPFSTWKWISFVFICLLHLFTIIPFLSSVVRRRYPFGSSFKGDWLNLYDLGGKHHYQNFYRSEDQLTMIERAGLKIKKRTNFGYVLTR